MREKEIGGEWGEGGRRKEMRDRGRKWKRSNQGKRGDETKEKRAE